MKGSIEFITGPMFSGKTEELIKRIHRVAFTKQTCKNFKPFKDDRYGINMIQSHLGRNIGAILVHDSIEIEIALENYKATNNGLYPDVIGIEEVQFFDEQIVQLIYDLKCHNVRVIVAGLDMDWQGNPFAISSTLMAIADSVDKQKAVCVVCGNNASHSYLKNKTGEIIQVGATDLYEARCFNHWKE